MQSSWDDANGNKQNDGEKRRAKHSRTKSPNTINHPTNDDRANECPDKYFGPSAASGQVANKVASDAAEHCADYSCD